MATFTVRYSVFHFRGFAGAGDFMGSLVLARNILLKLDPYNGIRFIPYPLPAGMLALPFALLGDRVAGTLFISLSTAILAGVMILKTGQTWRLLMLFSLQFAHALEWAQWSPLITAAWFIPVIAPLMVIVKPQIALPIFVNHWAGWGYLIAIIVLFVSLIISPRWPINWLNLITGYEFIIPLLLPGGFLLALSILNISSKHARLLLAMAVLPARAPYDLLPLFIIPKTPVQMITLVVLSWLVPAVVLYLVVLVYVLLGINIQSIRMKILLLRTKLKKY